MSERMKRIIVGSVSGGVTGIIMEVLRGSSYMAGISVATKAVITGIMACVIYMLIIKMITKGGPTGTSKA